MLVALGNKVMQTKVYPLFRWHLKFHQRGFILLLFIFSILLSVLYLSSTLIYQPSSGASVLVKFLPLAYEPASLTRVLDTFSYCPFFRSYNMSICIHNPNIDSWISATLIQGKMWEQITVDHFRRWLIRNPDLGLLDIGANIGVYSLMAAALGSHVISVEPMPANLRLLRQSVARNRLQSHVTVVPYAVSDRYENVTLQTQNNNQGLTVLTSSPCKSELGYICSHTETIRMDDLLSLPNFTSHFKTCVMKIDIEGHEYRTLLSIKDLWKQIDIQVMMMEWQWVTSTSGRKGWGQLKVRSFIAMMENMQYIARGPVYGEELNKSKWMFWPAEVMWTKKQFVF